MKDLSTQNINLTDLQQDALNKIEPILTDLKIEWVHRNNNYINIICPVHQSQDLGSSCIYLSNGRYKCWSRGCDEKIGFNLINLIKWGLSSNEHTASWDDVKKFVDGNAFDIIERPIIKRDKTLEELSLMDPCKYPSVTIPSKYYIDRGFSPEILKKYGVGDTDQYPYNGRSLVPVKSEDGRLMGFSGRSSYPICPKCEFYHSKYQGCIAKDYEFAHMHKKWFHSKGMQKSRTLYGINIIDKIDKIAIVEGPSCVWKLNEVGIPAGAVLGKSFSGAQASILINRGIKKVFLLSDQDDGGRQFKDSFIKNWSEVFEIYITTLPKKDVSEMTDEEIEKYIIKKWNKI